MKLLCVVPSYWPAFKFGGPTFSVHGLNKALVKKGVDVTVYTTNVGLNGGVPVNEEVVVDGIKVIYFTFAQFLEFTSEAGWQFSLPMAKSLKNNLKNFDIVYILSVWNFPTAAGAYYCRKYGKPYLISPRGLLYPFTTHKKSLKKLTYYHLVAKKYLKGAFGIHYTTQDEADKCHPLLGLRNCPIVVPNGIDLSEFENLPEKERLREHYPFLWDKKVILFLGRINWKKGLDILVEAYAKLAREKTDIHLLIAGNDEEGYGEKVKTWIKDYGMDYEDYGVRTKQYVDEIDAMNSTNAIDSKNPSNPTNPINSINPINPIRVTFTGMLTGKDKLEALAGSDIFVLPSYSENFAMAVLEAMACGLPVIISNQVGLHKDISEVKAGVVIETDAVQLAKKLTNLLNNPHICKEMGVNGRKLVKDKFTWNNVAGQMLEVYKRMLS